MTTRDAINRLLGRPMEEACLMVFWTVPAIMDLARGRRQAITPGDAAWVLQQAQTDHDCTVGITWDVLGSYLDRLPSAPKKKKKR